MRPIREETGSLANYRTCDKVMSSINGGATDCVGGQRHAPQHSSERTNQSVSSTVVVMEEVRVCLNWP